MIRGPRTVVYRVANLDRAKERYGAVLGFQPYLDEPFYVGLNVGGFELGLQPQGPAGPRQGTGVDGADAAFEGHFGLGATERDGVQDVGGDIRFATVLDPYGNVLGVIENPHFSLEGA